MPPRGPGLNVGPVGLDRGTTARSPRSLRTRAVAASVDSPPIRELEARGVVFHDYDLPGLKTVNHVCVLGSEKAAWFSDTEGNILCLHEDVS